MFIRAMRSGSSSYVIWTNILTTSWKNWSSHRVREALMASRVRFYEVETSCKQQELVVVLEPGARIKGK